MNTYFDQALTKSSEFIEIFQIAIKDFHPDPSLSVEINQENISFLNNRLDLANAIDKLLRGINISISRLPNDYQDNISGYIGIQILNSFQYFTSDSSVLSSDFLKVRIQKLQEDANKLYNTIYSIRELIPKGASATLQITIDNIERFGNLLKSQPNMPESTIDMIVDAINKHMELLIKQKDYLLSISKVNIDMATSVLFELKTLQNNAGFDAIELKYRNYKTLTKVTLNMLGDGFDFWIQQQGIPEIGAPGGVAAALAETLFFDSYLSEKENQSKKIHGFNVLTSVPLFVIPRAICVCGFLLIDQIHTNNLIDKIDTNKSNQ